jgi:hypothetical protein
VLKDVCLADIGIAGFKPMFFSGTGGNLYGSVIMYIRYLPELVHHIMILLSVFERINLPGSGTRAERTFRLVVDNGIANPELRHLDLLSGIDIRLLDCVE